MTANEADFGKVYQSIVAVIGALAKDGISKDRKNAQQGFQFRGIDDVYNALAPLLAQHKLCILPRVLDRTVSERETKSGGALFSVTVAVEFDIVSAEDGTHHTVRMYGEAMDSGDKATNKAMSAAYKYMALEVFCIPTEGEDADATTHEVAPKRTPQNDGVIRLPGDATKFNGHGGKPLTEVPTENLTGIRKFFHEKDATKNALLIAAIDDVLESRRPA